jgi:integrase
MKGLEFGTIAKRRGSWTFRYYAPDGNGNRVQIEKTLCEISDEYRSKKDVLPLAKAEIERLNAPQSGASRSGIVGFVESVYLPFVDEKKRPATANGYRKLWNGYLKEHFGKMRLAEYEPKHAAKFLDGLVDKGFGRHTVNHVRSLMSAIFKRAVRDGLVRVNPIRDVTVETPETAETPHYTVQEMRSILLALVNHPQAQTVMALAFIGLRPSEIAALRWDDLGWQDNDGEAVRVIQVQRSVWRGTVAPCKNKNSRRAVALGATVEALLGNYGTAVPSVSGYIFENSLGNPLDLNALSRDVIRPVLAEHGLEWKKYYAGRRGAETEMNRHTRGNSQITSHHFGHSKEVADAHYIKPIPEETRKAALALDAALAPKKLALRDKQGISLKATSAK